MNIRNTLTDVSPGRMHLLPPLPQPGVHHPQQRGGLQGASSGAGVNWEGGEVQGEGQARVNIFFSCAVSQVPVKAFTRFGPLVGREIRVEEMDFDEDRNKVFIIYTEEGKR